MIHLQQALAHHWHLSISQYWHLRLLCTIALGPLLGVLCLILFRKRSASESGMLRFKQSARMATLRPITPRLFS
jgi:hypothetical protein